jgi:hypothetical protein
MMGLWFLLLLISASANPWQYIRSYFSSDSRSQQVKLISDLIDLRVGKSFKRTIWHHKGVVRNMKSGNVVAGIDGLEFSTRLNDFPVPVNNNVSSITRAARSTGASLSYLSNKLFVYTSPTNSSLPLRKVRVRPYAPSRNVHPVVNFSQLILFGVEERNQRAYVNITMPSGRVLRSSQLEIVRNNNDAGIHVSLFVSAKKSPMLFSKYVSFAGTADANEHGYSREYYSLSSSKSILRSLVLRLMSLNKGIPRYSGVSTVSNYYDGGVSSSSCSTGRKQDKAFDATTTPDCVDAVASSTAWPGAAASTTSMRYQRIGEAPWWMGLGAQCILELQSVKYNSIRDIPAAALSFFRRANPDFVSSNSISTRQSVDELLSNFYSKHDAIDNFKSWHQRLFGATKRLCSSWLP